jgi:hypothetical protein
MMAPTMSEPGEQSCAFATFVTLRKTDEFKLELPPEVVKVV